MPRLVVEQRKGYRSFRKTPPPKLSEYGFANASPSADGRSGELRGIWGGSPAVFFETEEI